MTSISPLRGHDNDDDWTNSGNNHNNQVDHVIVPFIRSDDTNHIIDKPTTSQSTSLLNKKQTAHHSTTMRKFWGVFILITFLLFVSLLKEVRDNYIQEYSNDITQFVPLANYDTSELTFNQSDFQFIGNSTEPPACENINKQPDKCAFVKANCPSDALFDYLRLRYCHLTNNKIIATILSVIILGMALFLFLQLLGQTVEVFLIPALSTFSDQLKLSQAVSGLTFLSIGNGCGDVLVAIETIRKGAKSGEIGLVLGSLSGAALAVAVLALGCAIIAANNKSRISRGSFFRSMGGYAVVLLVGIALAMKSCLAFWDGIILMALWSVFVFVSATYLQQQELKKNKKKKIVRRLTFMRQTTSFQISLKKTATGGFSAVLLDDTDNTTGTNDTHRKVHNHEGQGDDYIDSSSDDDDEDYNNDDDDDAEMNRSGVAGTKRRGVSDLNSDQDLNKMEINDPTNNNNDNQQVTNNNNNSIVPLKLKPSSRGDALLLNHPVNKAKTPLPPPSPKSSPKVGYAPPTLNLQPPALDLQPIAEDDDAFGEPAQLQPAQHVGQISIITNNSPNGSLRDVNSINRTPGSTPPLTPGATNRLSRNFDHERSVSNLLQLTGAHKLNDDEKTLAALTAPVKSREGYGDEEDGDDDNDGDGEDTQSFMEGLSIPTSWKIKAVQKQDDDQQQQLQFPMQQMNNTPEEEDDDTKNDKKQSLISSIYEKVLFCILWPVSLLRWFSIPSTDHRPDYLKGLKRVLVHISPLPASFIFGMSFFGLDFAEAKLNWFVTLLVGIVSTILLNCTWFFYLKREVAVYNTKRAEIQSYVSSLKLRHDLDDDQLSEISELVVKWNLDQTKDELAKPFAMTIFQICIAFIAFLASISWLGIIAGEIVEILQTLGKMFGVSDSLLGLSVLAISNSVPDILSNVALARNGRKMRMAYSALFSAPILSSGFGFGLAVFLATLFGEVSVIKFTVSPLIMVCWAYVVVGIIVVFVGFPLQKFTPKPMFGYGLVALYFLFIISAIIAEFVG